MISIDSSRQYGSPPFPHWQQYSRIFAFSNIEKTYKFVSGITNQSRHGQYQVPPVPEIRSKCE